MITAREIGLVHNIAKNLAYGGRANNAYDDLVGMGCIGLVEADHSFDPTRGVAFSTLASVQIRGRMIDLIRKQRRWYGQSDWSSPQPRPRGGGSEDGVELSHTCRVADAAMPPVEPTPSIEAIIAGRELMARVMDLLDNLPELEARVLRARFLEDRSSRDIAEELNRSVRSINAICRQGLTRLRKRMAMVM